LAKSIISKIILLNMAEVIIVKGKTHLEELIKKETILN